MIGFVTNAGWLDTSTADGLRKCLAEEFSSIHVFHLRGNQRTSGELSRKEGGKIFDSGSRAPIAITLLVKNPETDEHGRILFHDIGDYLSRKEKLEKIATFGSLAGIPDWQVITPDAHGDWLKQRDDSFSDHIVLGDKKNEKIAIFKIYSNGVKTNRDNWVYNYSKSNLIENIKCTVDFYNSELLRYSKSFSSAESGARPLVEEFISFNDEKISWSRALREGVQRGRSIYYVDDALTIGVYRPFVKSNLYFHRSLINDVALIPKIFPGCGSKNISVVV